MERSNLDWCLDWANDMLVDERHLAHDRAYLESLFGWGVSRAWEAFGLVNDPHLPTNPDIRIVHKDEPRRAHVSVTGCSAITPDGIRVLVRGDRFPSQIIEKTINMDGLNHHYDLFLFHDLSAQRVRCEGLEPLPLAGQTWKLELKEHLADRTPERGWLRIGELVARDGSLTVNPRAIPPCTSIACHPRLIEVTKGSLGELESLLKNLSRLTLEPHVKGSRGSRPLAFQAPSFLFLCEQLVGVVGWAAEQLRMVIDLDGPPHSVFFCQRLLLRQLNAMLNAIGKTTPHPFFEVSGMHADREYFEKELAGSLSRKYSLARSGDHISTAYEVIQAFCGVMRRLVESIPTDERRVFGKTTPGEEW